MRFAHNCRAHRKTLTQNVGPLSVRELNETKSYWISLSQGTHFRNEVRALKTKARISQSSSLISLNPFLDEDQLLRVGGRKDNSKLPYETQHPLIIHGKYALTKLLICFEHSRLLHAGPTLLTASLSR